MLLILFNVAIVAWVVWSACSLFINYRQARCLGVPILISPVGQSNIVWLILQDFLAEHIARLPFNFGRWTRYNRRTWIWMFSDRGRIHQEYGPIIAHVTPAEVQVWVLDKDVINEILKGRDRALFDKPREEAKNIDFLGPHLITASLPHPFDLTATMANHSGTQADGETWKRHRRVVATPFTQRNNRLVWTESLHQGIRLAEHWLRGSHSGIRTVWGDCETAAMNVMVSAGFGLTRDDQHDFGHKGDGSFGLHSSLSYMISNFIWIIMIPPRMWFPRHLPPYPPSLRRFFISVRVFKEHLIRIVKDCKASTRSAGKTSVETSALPSDNLLTALIRHSEELKRENQASVGGVTTYRSSLTDDEIYANLFGLAFAGHETVAHTLAYMFFTLAIHPGVQTWVAQEIRAVLSSCPDGNIESLDLDETWPQLPRTRALMHESLRLFTPVPNVFKRSLSTSTVTLEVGSRSVRIPPRAYVLPSLWALHCAEEYWGPDSLEWNPRRWITIDDQGRESLTQPSPPGTFLAWSDGPRSCPGMRFSQVEFVGICTALLANFRISAVQLEGEDFDTAVGRVKAALLDSTSIVTLMVKNPDKIPLRLQRIQESKQT